MVEQAINLAQSGETADVVPKIQEVQRRAQELNLVAVHFAICRLQTAASLAEAVADSCTALVAQAPTVEPGAPVTGAISSALSDPWKLEIAAGSRVTITLSAADNSDLDPYLILYDSKFQLIEEHDDIEAVSSKTPRFMTLN